MRHRAAEQVGAYDLQEEIARTPMDQYVIWTGACGVTQPGSLRSRALACVDAAWTPILLRELLRRAAGLFGAQGYDPAAVRRAVADHQRARPAVYLLARKVAPGRFLAVSDIPFAGDPARRVRAGDPLFVDGEPWGADPGVAAGIVGSLQP
jgi:hypothetical protein